MNIKFATYYHGKVAREVLERDGYKCVLCSSSDDLNIDHIIPVREGGKHTLENQRTLCRGCHSVITNTKNGKLSKIGLYLREWRLKNPGYNRKKSQEFRDRNPKYYTKYSNKYKFYQSAF